MSVALRRVHMVHREGSRGRGEFSPQRSGVGISEIKLQVTSQSWAGLTVPLVDVGTIYIKERLALSVLSLLLNSHSPLLNIPVCQFSRTASTLCT